MFPIAYITDEATQSFEEAVRLAKELDLQGLELRSVEDTPIDQIDETTLKAYAEVLEREGLQVIALASSFYKDYLDTPGVTDAEMAMRLTSWAPRSFAASLVCPATASKHRSLSFYPTSKLPTGSWKRVARSSSWKPTPM